MLSSLVRYLLALPLLLWSFALAAQSGGAGYADVVPQLEHAREQLAAACAVGDTDACLSLQNLEEVIDAFERTNTACHEGDGNACRELAVGVGLLEAGNRCDEGELAACEQLRIIDSLAPACDAGDRRACERIEFVLFGS